MIPRTSPQDTHWKAALREAVTTPERLLDLLRLPRARWLAAARLAAAQFPLKVPLGFIRRMQKANAHDPLLRQVLPLADELQTHEGYSKDPVADLSSTLLPGLIHKYNKRALLISSGACAVHCRYCFRRHYPYGDSHAGGGNMRRIIEYLQAHDELNEVILSGGDPLMLDDAPLARLLDGIASVTHIQWIRVHSRMPVVLPQRITAELLQTLTRAKPVALVIHCNHPNEIDAQVRQALDDLHHADIRLYNQSVLLKGVNDAAPALCELSLKLFAARVQPYYLHCLDAVSGAAHFDLPEARATQLYRQMQAQLPGFLLPKLARDLPGNAHKTLVI